MSVESAASASSSPSKVSRRIWNSIVRRKKQLNDPREWRHHFTEFFYCSFFFAVQLVAVALRNNTFDRFVTSYWFRSSSIESFWLWLFSTPFYRVLPSFTEFYRVSIVRLEFERINFYIFNLFCRHRALDLVDLELWFDLDVIWLKYEKICGFSILSDVIYRFISK